MQKIYLDYNATTPIAPSVVEAMQPFLSTHYGNPSSSHSLGRVCHEAIVDAREKVAALLGATPNEIVFTSSGTESNNLALKGVMMQQPLDLGGHLVISGFEHPAIEEPARYLHRLGYGLSIVPCSAEGEVQPEAVEAAIRDDTLLVSIMHANNEIGTLQPIRRIAEICKAHEVLLHTDASQSIGKTRAFVDELAVDLLTLAGHKLYAPKGIGALFVREGIALEPFMHGAGHEAGLRAGTENVPYIVALGEAAKLAFNGMDENIDRMAMLRDRLFDQLSAGVGNELTINGHHAPRLPNTLSINFPGVNGAELLSRVPEICASTGSACHSSSDARSATLAAIGVSSQTAQGTVRLSVGWYTSEDDVDRAASLLIGAWESTRP